MNNLREAAQMALDVLELVDGYVMGKHEAKEALYEALAQPEQEPIKHWSDCAVHNAPAYPLGECNCGGFPVAWFDPKGVQLEFDIEDCFSLKEKEGYQPLYAIPTQQPEPPCKTGSQCVGGKCERCAEPEPVAKMREMLEVQGQDGTWNYDPYFHGMYNGMEFMLAMVEDREPVFRSSPGKWLGYTAPPQREWQGLTDENEIKHCWYEACQTDLELTSQLVVYFARAIEAKLKEKNT